MVTKYHFLSIGLHFLSFFGEVFVFFFFFFFEGVVAGQSNKGNSKLQPISLISYISKKKKEKKKKKKSCNKSVKLHFYYSTQKYDDSITIYFPFS